MLKIAILDDYQRVAFDLADWSRLGPDVECKSFAHHLHTVEQAVEALADFDVVCAIRERMPFPSELLEKLPRLKLIVFSGSRSRAVDLDVAKRLGIVVITAPTSETDDLSPDPNGPGYPAIVELTWALILACARNVCAQNEDIRDGRWEATTPMVLSGKTIGMVGFGRIGSTMGRLARAFGMELVAWSQNLTAERAREGGARLVTKDELFQSSDVISVHLRLSDRSIDTIGDREFGLMKPNAILINTSRGPIVNEKAMVAALSKRRIKAVGLDVYDIEPLPADHPLQALDNAIMMPHVGYATDKNYPKAYNAMIEGIMAWRLGAPVLVFSGADGAR